MDSDIDYALQVVTNRLPAAGIDCLMIGGHAVNHYGVIRATQDIDFMIAAPDSQRVRQQMYDAGFTNIAEHESVMFFNRPDSPLRVDFLTVDADTMAKLMENAVKVHYAGSLHVWVPRLHDLLAMKLFALTTGGPKRKDKDFGDIVHLVLENGVDPDAELHELSRTFGSEAAYAELRERIEALRHA
jgi:hypothetical protein